jgi:site-specific DNA recombinase
MKQRALRQFKGRGRKSLFARVAFCADCGAGINYKNDRQSYVCSTYQKNTAKNCSSHIIQHAALKQVVLTNLKDLIDNSLNMQSLVDVTMQRAGIKKNKAAKELDRVQHEISKLDKELVQLTRKWTSGDIDKEMFNACSVAVKNERQALEEPMARLQTEIAHEHNTESRV